MIPAIHSEFRKFFSTRMWWVLLICMVVYTAFGAAIMAAMIDAMEGIAAGMITAPSSVYTVAAAMAYVFPTIIGTMSVTGEYRHQTITPTFLAEPRRAIVLGAKMIGSAPMGLAFGVVGGLTSLGVGGGLLALLGEDTHFDDPLSYRNLALGAVALMLWTMIGVGLGALLRNQVAAIVVLLVFNQLVEPLARAALMATDHADIAKFFPGAAGEALAGSGGGFFGIGGEVGLGEMPPWAGGLVMVAYAVIFALVGYAVTTRRDVT
jgi:ABC-type transport system involved in multi-copper enzyme maturation permease subunit